MTALALQLPSPLIEEEEDRPKCFSCLTEVERLSDLDDSNVEGEFLCCVCCVEWPFPRWRGEGRAVGGINTLAETV